MNPNAVTKESKRFHGSETFFVCVIHQFSLKKNYISITLNPIAQTPPNSLFVQAYIMKLFKDVSLKLNFCTYEKAAMGLYYHNLFGCNRL